MKYYDPIIIILYNKRDGKFHPAFVSKNTPNMVDTNEKFSHIYRGTIVAYQRNGYDTMDEARKEVEEVIINEVKGSIPFTEDYINWDGNGLRLPSYNIFFEHDENGKIYMMLP